MQPHPVAGGEIPVNRTRPRSRRRKARQQETRQKQQDRRKHTHGLNCRPYRTPVNKAPMNEPQPPRKAAIGALLLIVLIVVGGIWIQRHIRANTLIEDCVMQGRRNCAPISQ
jgi:hypothetical protein